MTLYELLSLIVSVAGFIAIIATLIFLIRQTKEITKQSKYVAESIKVSIFQGNDNRSFEMGRLFVDYPELRPYFYQGQDIQEDDPAYGKAIAIADLLLDFFDTILLQPQYLPAAFIRESWGTVIDDIFAKSPILCRHWHAVQDWHSNELEKIVRAVEERQQLSPSSKKRLKKSTGETKRVKSAVEN